MLEKEVRGECGQHKLKLNLSYWKSRGLLRVIDINRIDTSLKYQYVIRRQKPKCIANKTMHTHGLSTLDYFL